ncbi:MAG TPA: hypothetical protein VF315_08055, partial [Steroidobacteraceae bacterium]
RRAKQCRSVGVLHIMLKRYCIIAGAALAFIAGCASAPSTRVVTADALETILAGDQRAPENKARDQYRHPRETLLFFGIRPEMTVVEVWPSNGWYTEILAPLLREKGKYYAAQVEPNPDNKFVTAELQNFRDKLSARPDLYDRVIVTAFGPAGADIAPPGTVDLIVTFRNIHNWMARGNAPQAFALMYKALKPGGTLGVVEHRGKSGVPQDPKAQNGYVSEEYAITLIESVGFKLIAKSEINANPNDTKDYEQGVWTLPPNYRLGSKDHDKYAAIGESDRFTLRFMKPKS